MELPQSIEKLIEEFRKLPSLGYRSSEKVALYLMKKPEYDLDRFCRTIISAKKTVKYCKICTMLSDNETCPICAGARRDTSIICVVSEISDLISIENTGDYTGLYHVLHGELSPLDGVGPEQLSFDKLWERLGTGDGVEGSVKEIIIATNPTFEGESTAFYIKKYLRERYPSLAVSRLAQGIPQGGSVEYLDHITLGKAIKGRKEMD